MRLPAKTRWVWQSISPGVSQAPPRSWTAPAQRSGAPGRSFWGPTQAMRPPCTATAPSRIGAIGRGPAGHRRHVTADPEGVPLAPSLAILCRLGLSIQAGFTVTSIHARSALLPDAWATDVTLHIDAGGRIARVSAPRGPRDVRGRGARHAQHSQPRLPARDGRAGRAGRPWPGFVPGPGGNGCMAVRAGSRPPRSRPSPRSLYVEMLEAGYTSVCEFHYLHHGPGGAPLPDPAAASRALIARGGGSRHPA